MRQTQINSLRKNIHFVDFIGLIANFSLIHRFNCCKLLNDAGMLIFYCRNITQTISTSTKQSCSWPMHLKLEKTKICFTRKQFIISLSQLEATAAAVFAQFSLKQPCTFESNISKTSKQKLMLDTKLNDRNGIWNTASRPWQDIFSRNCQIFLYRKIFRDALALRASIMSQNP